jgi:signal peptidase I
VSSPDDGRGTAADDGRGAGVGEGTGAGRRAAHGVLGALRETAIVVVIALGLSLLVKTFLLQAFFIPSVSMRDTLEVGDRVVVSKLTPGPLSLQRGDVVVFTDPGGWLEGETVTPSTNPVREALAFIGLLPNDSGNHLIKRVIGLPGDHVKCCDSSGRLSVDGTPITETYLRSGSQPSERPFDITVPAGRIWVMGDNRQESADSRSHDDGTGRTGTVPIDDVTGRALAVVWPFSHGSWLGRYPGVFAGVKPVSP